jgi:Tol biopolymer transport system component
VASDIAWSHDGNSFAYAEGNELFIANSDGESPRTLAKVADVTSGIDHIRWSPDDRRLRFTLTGPATRSLWEVDADGRNFHEMHFKWPGNALECCGDWTSNGRYFVFRSNRNGIYNLWALEEKSDWWHRSNPDPVQLTFGPVNYFEPTPSRNGHSIFAIGVQPFGELVRYDAGRKDFRPFLQGRSITRLAFSRDGKWLAYVAYPEGTLWRSRSDGTEQIQLTFPPLQVGPVRWSADDERIAFSAVQPGQLWKSFVISARGGNPQPFPSESLSQSSPDWMPDRDALIYSRSYGAENPRLYLYDALSGRTESISGSDGLHGPQWSPNGHYLAASDAASDALVLIDPRSGKRNQLVGAPVVWPTWSADSQYIYFLRWGIDSILRVHVPDGREEKVLQVPFPLASWPFTVAPDGTLILLRDRSRYDVYALSLSLP